MDTSPAIESNSETWSPNTGHSELKKATTDTLWPSKRPGLSDLSRSGEILKGILPNCMKHNKANQTKAMIFFFHITKCMSGVHIISEAIFSSKFADFTKNQQHGPIMPLIFPINAFLLLVFR